jgi:ATP-dependent exoDNAse (exonuclease V) beta subunit
MPGLPRLNADQSAVVAALEGDVVVVAGAGSGKTRVLAERRGGLKAARWRAHC